MAVALPFVGAAIGGYFGGPTGAQIGWLLGSWMYNATRDKENDVFDPGAEEMPRFNQALRGATMPVLFGTNRVSSNIVWTKNFNTIRHESSASGGGGKGGGSGTGAKAGGPGSTGTSYEYKWDLIIHLGMSDSDMSLFGGWLAAERLNDEVLLAIINNSNLGYNMGLFASLVVRPKNAQLDFEEGFFHGSLATGSTIAENWSHFETSEGYPFRFPYTSYVGFKQLNLGAHAIVPQLSWEIGPGGIVVTYNPSFGDYYTSHVLSTASAKGPAGGVLRGEDGKLYHWDASGGNNLGRLRNVTDGSTTTTLTDTQFDTDATDLGLDPGSAYSFTDAIGSGRIPGSNYILCWGEDIGVGSRSNWAFIIYKVNSSGVLEAVGGYQGRSNTTENLDGNLAIGLFGEQTNDDAILIMGNSQVGADYEYYLAALPSINEFISVTLEDSASNNLESRMTSIRTNVAEIASYFGIHSSYRPYNDHMGFFLPVVTITLGIPIWTTKMCFYIGKSDIEWHNDNPGMAGGPGCQTIYDVAGTYPNGLIASVEFSASNPYAITMDANWTVENANFIDASSEEAVVPFADSGYRYDETTVDDLDDYDPSPAIQKLSNGAGAGATLIMFFKNVSPGGDRGSGSPNTSTKVQAFLWNPLEQKAKRYGVKSGSFADSDADWGIGTGSYIIQGISGYYDESTSELYVAGGVDGGGANDEVFVSTFGSLDISGGEDLLPPYIIYKILTSPVYGLGIATTDIDTSTYELALQYCDSEDIRVSTQYRREEGALSVIDALLSVYGGYLIDSGGKIKFGLQNFAASSAVVRTLDNDHLVVRSDEPPVRIIKSARQDTYNKVKVNYFDRSLEYRQNFVEIADEVDIDLNGVRPQEFPPKFVMSEATANKMAIRALWANLYNRDVFEFHLGPKDADLEPGDVVTLVDSYHSALQGGKQVRIVQWAEREPLIFDVQAVEEIQYVAEATLDVSSATEATQNTLFTEVTPAADFTMYELPYEFQGADAKVFVGYRQQSTCKGARLYTSADGVSFAQVQETQPYIISGILADALPSRDPGYVEENITVYLMPDTYSGNWSPASGTWAQTFQLDDVSANGRALGAGLFWINSEMLAYEGVNLLDQNSYRLDKVYRGWGGTHIQGHSSGDTFHKHGGGIFAQAINEDKIGTVIHYKVAPFNFAGMEYNIASVDARTYAIQGTFFRPQNLPGISTFVQSPASYLTVQSEDLGSISRKQVVTGGSPVQFEWYESARARGWGARGYGNGGYGRFEQDTSSVQWRVEVLSSDLSTVVRCTTVATVAYLYSVDANSTDFNGWNGSFSVRVTPFNEFGDALNNRTKTLELFE